MPELTGLANLIRLTHRFQQVRRSNLAADGERESDSEHSFQLALAAWYLIEALPSLTNSLDRWKVVSYALVHDLPEAYAGDVDPYYSSQSDIQLKAHNEHCALERLKQEFNGSFPGMCERIAEYELKKKGSDQAKPDREAQFVYALDKLLVCLNIYMLNDPYYAILECKRVVSMRVDMERQLEKASVSPEIVGLFKELIRIASMNNGEADGLGF
jgi:5'-deoxynucleotidase YfbR-like HD superfamily hydrolase